MVYLGLEEGDCDPHDDEDQQENVALPSTTKKIHQVSSQSDNPTKITIKTTTLEVATPASTSHHHHGHRKRRPKEFASPSSESRIHVVNNEGPDTSSQRSGEGSSNSVGNHSGSDSGLERCSVTIQFDLNTKKLWQELHYPYGNYTSFFRHLILLEKYWRSGDLTLSPTASQKSSVYIKSVHNRIEAYEGKHKRSDADLSASTRPDMNVPPAPPLVHVPGGSPTVVDVTPPTAKPVEKESKKETPTGSTILKIPRLPQIPMITSEDEQQQQHHQHQQQQQHQLQQQTQMPTKIRVRTDLMHLGLMAKPAPNLMASPKPSDTPATNNASQQLSVMASRAAADVRCPRPCHLRCSSRGPT